MILVRKTVKSNFSGFDAKPAERIYTNSGLKIIPKPVRIEVVAITSPNVFAANFLAASMVRLLLLGYFQFIRLVLPALPMAQEGREIFF